MKKFTLLKSLFLAAVLAVGSGSAFCETITITLENTAINTEKKYDFVIDGISFTADKVKKQNTNIFFRENQGYLYNTTSLGSINSITIHYGQGGSGAAKQYFTSGTEAITTYQKGTAQLTTSKPGESGTYSKFAGGFFNISISGKNLQASSIVIDYTLDETTVVATPTFSPEAGEYTNSVEVTLACETEDAVIRYTRNGDEPTEESEEYVGAFNLTETTTVKAKAFKADMTASKTAEATYTIKTDKPAIYSDVETISEMSVRVNETAGRNITISGENLTENITLAISGDDADQFSVSPATIELTDGKAQETKVTVSYAPQAEGTHTATLTVSSGEVAPLVFALNGTAQAALIPSAVIITEVYGGGSNKNATYNADFVELYNTSADDVDMSNWSIQYYSKEGTDPQTIGFTAGTMIKANDYFLVQMSKAGTNYGDDLPQADFLYSNSSVDLQYDEVNMSAKDGKVALFATAEPQELSSTHDIDLILNNEFFRDYVVFGAGAPLMGDRFEGSSANLSATRKQSEGAFVYTFNVGNDFEAATPTPQASTATGPGTGISSLETGSLYATDGAIHFNAAAGERVEIYNAVGQTVYTGTTAEGVNTIAVKAGALIVKVGGAVNKVIVK